MNLFGTINSRLERYSLEKKKIYIIPSKSGFVFIGIMFTNFLIGLSYGNNLTLCVAFILFTYFIIQMLTTHKHLSLLDVKEIRFKNNFANLKIECSITSKDLIIDDCYALTFNKNTKINLKLKNNLLTGSIKLKRGIYRERNLRISNTGQSGLFYVWRYFPISYEIYIYPERIHTNPPNLFNVIENEKAIDENEFHSHIPYTSGMPSKRLNWKLFARTETLYWKKFTGVNQGNIKLDYYKLDGNKETKLSYLAYLIHKAYQNNLTWSLTIPGNYIDNCSGHDDYIICLRLLSGIDYD